MGKWQIGYDDFNRLCRVEHPDDWLFGYSVRKTGVYAVGWDESDGLMSPSEGMPKCWHPTGDLSEPALRFPCSLSELQEFLEKAGGYGSIDPFDMADFALDWIKSTAEIPELQRELRGAERMDPLREELRAALAELGPGASMKQVLQRLGEYAGQPWSCIKMVARAGVHWQKSSGVIEICDGKALQQRLKRLKEAAH